MKHNLIAIALLLLGTGLCAQVASQNELPEAPSASIAPKAPTRPPTEAPPAAAASPKVVEEQAPPATPTLEDPAYKKAAPAESKVEAPKPAVPKPDPVTNASASPAPAPTGDVDDSLPTFRKSVEEVNLVFTVTDKRGRFVRDLTKNDFKILDDKKPPLSIAGFSSETNLPLRVGLLVDASNSIRDRFRFEQDAAIEFLNQVVRSRFDKAFVIGFDTTAELTQDFTDNTELLSKGVRSLRPGGGTAMFDAVYFACRDKLMKDQSSTATRRAIILVSDGEDNQSRVTREETIEICQRAEVIVYAISTNVSGVKLRGDKVIERLADATGGRAFFPFKLQEVSNAFSEIEDELRSQYALAYKPADFQSNGQYRSIEITAVNHKNLQVRARRGYYAPKP